MHLHCAPCEQGEPPETPLRVSRKKNKNPASDNTPHHICPSGELILMGIYDDSDGMNVGGSLARVNSKPYGAAAAAGLAVKIKIKIKLTHIIFCIKEVRKLSIKDGKK